VALEKYGRWPEVCHALGISYNTLYALRNSNKYVSDDVVLRLLGAKTLPPVWERREWTLKSELMKSGAWKRSGGRRLVIRDGRKMCTGPKHPEGGEWVRLSNFSYHKTGPREGKPFSRCKDCSKAGRLKNYRGVQGRIAISRVRWVFRELETRIGRREVVRRGGFSWNLWGRLENNRYVWKWTAYRAINLLREVREEQKHERV
jgi:hypothetical protein